MYLEWRSTAELGAMPWGVIRLANMFSNELADAQEHFNRVKLKNSQPSDTEKSTATYAFIKLEGEFDNNHQISQCKAQQIYNFNEEQFPQDEYHLPDNDSQPATLDTSLTTNPDNPYIRAAPVIDSDQDPLSIFDYIPKKEQNIIEDDAGNIKNTAPLHTLPTYQVTEDNADIKYWLIKHELEEDNVYSSTNEPRLNLELSDQETIHMHIDCSNLYQNQNKGNIDNIETSVNKRSLYNGSLGKSSVNFNSLSVNKNNVYECGTCGYQTFIKPALIHHVRKHLINTMPINDTQIKNSFYTTKFHYPPDIAARKPYKCPDCPYNTTKEVVFQEQMNNTHICKSRRRSIELQPYKCDICNYVAGQRSNFLAHIRTHTGEKPFKCEMCDYRTSRKYCLTTHMNIHTGAKPFKCDLCDYRFSKNNNLKQHMTKHTGDRPFNCEICDYRASTKGNLIVHIKLHSGDKPFICETWGYSAAVKGSLVRHIQTHTREKQFKCQICDYSALRKDQLKRHFKMHKMSAI